MLLILFCLLVISAPYVRGTGPQQPGPQQPGPQQPGPQQPGPQQPGPQQPQCSDRGTDCPRSQYLCQHPVYVPLMRQECPMTCNYCASPQNNPTNNGGQPGQQQPQQPQQPGGQQQPQCSDRGTDCPKTSYLCNNALYMPLMRQECPMTCNLCQQQPGG